MLRPIHHGHRLTRRPPSASPVPASARPDADAPAEAAQSTPPAAPALTADEKADLFRKFDSYMAHPDRAAGSAP